MLTRKQKEEIVQGLSEDLAQAKASVFVDFKGLTASDIAALKKELRTNGATFRVVKKTLLSRSLNSVNVSIDPDALKGQVAVAISLNDEVSAAKVIQKFSKEHESMKMLAGVLGTKALSAEEVSALAQLPSLEALRGQLVSVLAGPMRGFVSVLNGTTSGFVRTLKAIAEQKQA
ncbi:MAG TPA: 50S ribosomal protein L10 [Patescibacteria group bacterium]|nr:50S ribosomal protein L10 [Patescibacteria group bacterium]